MPIPLERHAVPLQAARSDAIDLFYSVLRICPYDNSCVESFFATLKNEQIFKRKFDTMEEIQRDVFEYIELFYILNILKALNNKGMTIVMVTHDEDVANICNRIVVLKKN